MIAIQLGKLQVAGVPVLWRPLHEAEGGWFWWGRAGSGVFVQLWRMLYARLVEHHGLRNLVWVYTSAGDCCTSHAWYPGDHVVDVIATDAYGKQVGFCKFCFPLSFACTWGSSVEKACFITMLLLHAQHGVPHHQSIMCTLHHSLVCMGAMLGATTNAPSSPVGPPSSWHWVKLMLSPAWTHVLLTWHPGLGFVCGADTLPRMGCIIHQRC